MGRKRERERGEKGESVVTEGDELAFADGASSSENGSRGMMGVNEEEDDDDEVDDDLAAAAAAAGENLHLGEDDDDDSESDLE